MCAMLWQSSQKQAIYTCGRYSLRDGIQQRPTTDRCAKDLEDETMAKKKKKKGRASRARAIEESGLDYVERVCLVCNLLCDGCPPAQVKKLLLKKKGIEMSREAAYRYFAYAAKRGWIQFAAPPEYALRDRVKESHTWLHGVEIVHTSVCNDVADKAAGMLLELLRARRRAPYNRGEVHVGFAGGHVMARVARTLARLLRQGTDGLPEVVVLHALVAGFNVDEPLTAPAGFFTYFANDPAMPVDIRFVSLSAPPMVETKQLKILRRLAGIREAYERVSELDIIVTSVGAFSQTCSHSMLLEYMKQSPPSLEKLKKTKYCGDMLWRPMGPEGPIEIETKIRAMTLFELGSLPELISQGKSVLLVVGPCRICNEPRTEILKSIVDYKEHLITHLVADGRSASAVTGEAA